VGKSSLWEEKKREEEERGETVVSLEHSAVSILTTVLTSACPALEETPRLPKKESGIKRRKGAESYSRAVVEQTPCAHKENGCLRGRDHLG